MNADEIKDFVVKAVNGAVSTHLSRTLDKQFEENNSRIFEQLRELIPQPQEANVVTSAGNPDVDAAIKNATAPLMKQLEEQRATAERQRAQADQERQTRLRNEETSALQTALTSAGVPAPLAAAAVNTLHPKIERDAQGNILFVQQDTGPTGAFEQRVSVQEGIESFLKTEDGKHFLPARPVSGAGNMGGNAPSGVSPHQQSDRELVADMLGAFEGLG
jgi:hypothetical protein